MLANRCALGILGLLVLSNCLCFAWGGFPPRICTHAELTKAALLDVNKSLADAIENNADGPDFHRFFCVSDCANICARIGVIKRLPGLPDWLKVAIAAICHQCKKYECSKESPCLIDDRNTRCSDTHGHRITRFMMDIEEEVGRYCRMYMGGECVAGGAEEGAAYWAKRAQEAYRKNPRGEEWKKYLGWATHYLADALCPPHCYDPRSQHDKLEFWFKDDLFPLIPGRQSRDFLFEFGLQILDWFTSFGRRAALVCAVLALLEPSVKIEVLCEAVDRLLSWLDQQHSWGWLKNYKDWVRNPYSILPPGSLDSQVRFVDVEHIRTWIIAKAEQIAHMPVSSDWPYLSETDLKKVFAWISIGVRGLLRFVTGINLSSPNGGEVWVVGSTVTIRWQSIGGKDLKVDIKLSRDGGLTWETIKKDTPNDGEEKWKVTGHVTTRAMIQIGGDISDSQFAIVHPGILAGTSNPGKVYVLKETGWDTISEELGFAVLSLIEYKGKLYAGVMTRDNKGQLYQYIGGKTWKLVCDNLDQQVSSLAVYKGRLYIGTSGTGGRLYEFDEKKNQCPLPPVVDHKFPGNWSGFRSAYVWGGYLYLGDIEYDIIGRFDQKKFEHIAHLGGSCIFDFAEYKGALFAAAWRGSLHRSTDGIVWTKRFAQPETTHLWELEVFKGWLAMGFESGTLRRFDGTRFETVWIAPTSIIAMVAHKDEMLYLGTGREAGYTGFRPGVGKEEGKVYAYDGISVMPISGLLGAGIQVLYVSGIRTLRPKDVDTDVDTIDEHEPPIEVETIRVTNIPNPIRGVHTTTFRVMGEAADRVEELRVRVFDLAGQLVWEATIEDNELTWNTQDLLGRYLANGVYLYQAQVKIDGEWFTLKLEKLAILR